MSNKDRQAVLDTLAALDKFIVNGTQTAARCRLVGQQLDGVAQQMQEVATFVDNLVAFTGGLQRAIRGALPKPDLRPVKGGKAAQDGAGGSGSPPAA